MTRRTAWALLTNVNGSYIGLPFLVFLTVGALLAPSGRIADLLMRLGFTAATLVGLLTGTTLAEIKVKPLSYVLPGQETSMAPAVVLVGAVLCLAYALLLLGRPMTAIAVPAWQQSLAAFGFGLGLFTLVVAACVVTHDTAFTSLATVAPFILVMGALRNEPLGTAWVSLSIAVAESPFIALLFAASGVVAVFRVLGDRAHSRRLCGAPFMPLKAYDNPFKMDDHRRRMRSGAFRPSMMTDSRASPGGLAMAALSRRVIGTSWDYLVLETRVTGTRWEFAYKLVSLVLLLALMSLLYARSERPPQTLFGPFMFVFMTFVFFPPTFRARLSPMPPVSRHRHFRSFLAKGVSVYVLTMIAAALVVLGMRAVNGTAIGSESATLTAATSLPLREVIVVTAAVPILCWAHAALRSAIGFLLFMMAFVVLVSVVMQAAQAFLLAQSYSVLLLATAVCWLPFVHIAWKRCLRDDLLLL